MFNSAEANPTLQTFAKTLAAMGLQAEIRYKKCLGEKSRFG